MVVSILPYPHKTSSLCEHGAELGRASFGVSPHKGVNLIISGPPPLEDLVITSLWALHIITLEVRVSSYEFGVNAVQSMLHQL